MKQPGFSLPQWFLAVLIGYASGDRLAAFADSPCVEECTAIHTLTGEFSGDQFGWKSNNIGDVTGDGIDDFVVTSPTNDGGGNNAGRIYVYDSASGSEVFRVTGQTSGGQLGIDANKTGDINGDGGYDPLLCPLQRRSADF